MKRTDPSTSAFLIKIGDDGVLALSIPEMAGKNMIVEQRHGYLMVSPFDLDWEAGQGVIARREGNWTLLGTPSGEIPRV